MKHKARMVATGHIRRWVVLIALCLGLPPSAWAQDLATMQAQNRTMARDVLEQLLAEDDFVSYNRDALGRDEVWLKSQPRAADEDGMCARDILTIRRAPDIGDDAGSGGIREVVARRWFYVLTDATGQPAWDVQGDELERRCAASGGQDSRWFAADNAQVARSTVAGLFALREELRNPRSRVIAWDCRPAGGCPSRTDLAELINPLTPPMATQANYQGCERGSWCVATLVERPDCGAFSTLLVMDGVETDLFRTARIDRPVGLLSCGEADMQEPAF